MGDPSTNPDGDLLAELTARLRSVVDVADRVHGLTRRRFPRCFVGEEAVRCMVERGMASDAGEAVRIGRLLVQGGCLHHVLREHDFEDAYLFYRFAADESHGEAGRDASGATVSWADLLPGGSAGDDRDDSLQPAIPERDPRLAELAQDVLDEIGVSPLDAHNVRLLDHVHPKHWKAPTAAERYNLVVIGAGAGGLVSAAAAAGVGGRVALIESHLLGGDCLNVGCVPSKALLRSAKAVAAVRAASALGVRVSGEVSVDFPAVMERMRRLRADIAPHDSATRFAEELGIDVFIGRAAFTAPDTVEVGGQRLRFARAIVATGGTAAIPDIPGLDGIPHLTNATVFNLTALPARLCVLGAGPIGVELAQCFARFGARVTVIGRDRTILPREDVDAADVVAAALVRDGVELRLGITPTRFERDGDGVAVSLPDQAAPLRFDAVLVAAGRKPAVAGLGLEAAGVAFDARAGVQVDDRLQTTNPRVYAVGDVASRYQFTHMADFMARAAVRNALFFGRERVSRLLVPWATYTDPEIAHVGLYPRDIESRGMAFETYRRDFAEVDRTRLDGETEGFVKIHVERGSDRILGATIVGAHAGEMIGEIALAMRSGTGLGALASVIHPYPTASEAIRQCGDLYNRTRLTPTVKAIFERLLAFQRR
ncbi:MAG: FAD-containing oxidoreductase [Ectothiorhodospiraceae bacterium]|nr:FAD-containing oxidoreductase [Ectothiorhodospiraceae bacterium]